MSEDTRHNALYLHRMELLLKVAETADEQGVHHPSTLLHSASPPAAVDTVLAGLRDLELAGYMTRSAEAGLNDESVMTPHGRAALDDMMRRREHDTSGRNAACRKAIAAWLVRIADRSAAVGDWRKFTQEEGNDWHLAPFPEHTIDRASAWLKEQGYLTGIAAWGSQRVLRPSITSQGESWHEQGAPMTSCCGS